MYGSYLVLFVLFAVERYILRPVSAGATKAGAKAKGQ